MSKTTLYYFSATGNSLAVARYLAEKLDVGDPVSVPGSLVNEDPYLDARDAKTIGFIFPVQRATLPEMLRGFIQSMPIDPQCYYFAVATYSLFGSNEFWDIDDLLSERGAMLNYAASVRMMGNVGLKQPSNATIKRRLEHMERQVDDIATSVAYHQENYFPRSKKLLGEAVRAFTDLRRRSIVFHIDKHCKHCGICAQVCPAQNITLPKKDSGTSAPIRSDKCEACLACVHWCPAAAISSPSLFHTSYHNPTVSPDELHTPAAHTRTQDEGDHSKGAKRDGAMDKNATLADTLRDDVLAPKDIESWLGENQDEPTSHLYRVSSKVHEQHPFEHTASAMSDAEIARALSDLES